jgi:hypothetical protein
MHAPLIRKKIETDDDVRTLSVRGVDPERKKEITKLKGDLARKKEELESEQMEYTSALRKSRDLLRRRGADVAAQEEERALLKSKADELKASLQLYADRG